MACLKNVEMEHLSPRQRELAEIIGLENYLKLVKAFGGECFYLPVEAALLRQIMHSEICQRAKTENYKKLAVEYNLSLKTIYNIAKSGQ